VDPAKDLTSLERLTRAHDLGVSAMLGETIYNFGELVKPLLYESHNEWLLTFGFS
jgi:hypothetical protein